MFIMSLNEKKAFPKIFKEKRDRQPNWSEAEKQFLLMLTKRHRSILENKGSDSTTIKKKSDAWDEITFNMNAAGFQRSKERLKQQLGRIKSAVAKKAKDALTTEILMSDSRSTEPSTVGSRMQGKNIYIERKIGANNTTRMNSELQRKNCITHNGEVFIKIEKAMDEFEEPLTECETKHHATEQLIPNLENQKLGSEMMLETNNSNEKNQHFDKNLMFSHPPSSDDSCKILSSKAKRKNFFVRSNRINQLHQIRLAIERERLLALRLQRKRDTLLYQKDMQIQNMKMQILQNLINQNKNNHINL